jgi:hypothetical protein
MSKPITFKQWLKTESGKVYLIVSSAFTLCFSAFQVVKLFGIQKLPLPSLPTTDEGWLMVNFAIQVAFIGYVVFFTAYRFSKIKNADDSNPSEEIIWQRLELHDPAHERHEQNGDRYETETLEAWIKFKKGANRVVKQFAWFWVLAWFSWLLHYTYLLATALHLLPSNAAVRNLVNNLNSLMFVFLFMTLTVSTSKYGALFWSKLVCLIFVVFGLELLVHGISHGNPVTSLTFTALSGLFASVALAAFIGSIDSKFINVPVWLIPFLYLYAAIQALYVFFEFHEVASQMVASNVPTFVNKTQITVTIFAFVLKAVLFMTVTWILRTGRLVYFMIEESSLNFRRDRNFAEFLDTVKIEESQLT